jgi:hypothetical protein
MCPWNLCLIIFLFLETSWIVVELLEEGVARPAAAHDDEEDWAAAQEYRHGRARANQVGLYCLPVDMEHVFPDRGD